MRLVEVYDIVAKNRPPIGDWGVYVCAIRQREYAYEARQVSFKLARYKGNVKNSLPKRPTCTPKDELNVH